MNYERKIQIWVPQKRSLFCAATFTQTFHQSVRDNKDLNNKQTNKKESLYRNFLTDIWSNSWATIKISTINQKKECLYSNFHTDISWNSWATVKISTINQKKGVFVQQLSYRHFIKQLGDNKDLKNKPKQGVFVQQLSYRHLIEQLGDYLVKKTISYLGEGATAGGEVPIWSDWFWFAFGSSNYFKQIPKFFNK